ncbi:MAG TPA: restriction endonuclease subunit S [Candidatus Paceibacterota bacterium]|nr:restriction endonuclease subunit S [Candidatus Paceibacterota bacterium]
MAAEWEEATLGDVSTKITKGTTPTTLGYEFVPEGVNFVKVESITDDGRLLPQKFAHITNETHQALSRSVLEKDDILFSIAGAIGRSALVNNDVLPANTNQAVAIVRPDVGKVSPRFLAFLLQDKKVVRFTNSIVAQSVQANINLQQLSGLEIPLPSLEEQRSIAAVLSSLDDKIELLRKQNETLEQIAQAIFNEWFVKPTADGSLPDGWQMAGLTDIADFLNGIALQKYPAIDGEPSLPAIKIRELKAGITEATDKVNAGVPAQYIIEDGDLLFSWSGSLEVVLWRYGKGALNQHLFKVSSDKYPQWFVYLWLLHHLPDFRTIAANKATTMGHIQRHHLDQAEVVVPDEKTLSDADALLAPIFNKVIANNSQLGLLPSLRDALLPQLMSGEIRV